MVKRLLRTVFTALLLTAVLVLGAPGLSVAASLRGPGVAHPATWLGSYATFGGKPWAFCVDAGRAAPEPTYRWRAKPVTDPATSYLLTRYAGSKRVVDHAALSYLVHRSAKLPHDARTKVPSTPPTVRGVDLPGRVKQLSAESRDQMGPYRVNVALDLAEDRKGSVTVSTLAASGKHSSGWSADVTLSGPAKWVDGATQTRAFTTGPGPAAFTVKVTGAGKVRVTARVNVPADQVRLHTPNRSGVQRVVTATPLERVSGSKEQVVAPFQPRVVTKASAAVVEGPGELTDRLAVSVADGPAWLPGHRVTVRSTLWGPFTDRPVPADAAPSGAPVAGRVQTVVDRPGEWDTPPVRVTQPGYYVWTEQIAADTQQTGWTSRFGVAEETTLLTWQPQVVTQASTEQAEVGAELTDLLTVTGVRAGSELEVVSRLWGPFTKRPAEADEVPTGAPMAGEVSTTVVGDGEYRTAGVTPEKPGYYVWTETIAADEHHAGWTSRFGVARETTLLTAPPPPAPESEVVPEPEPQAPEPRPTGQPKPKPQPTATPEPVVTPSAQPKTRATRAPDLAAPARPKAASAPKRTMSRLPETGTAASGFALIGGGAVASGAGLLLLGSALRRGGRHAAR
jgi:outer membrane biosynthesis protein TonB